MTDIPGDPSTTTQLVLNGPGLTSQTDYQDRDWIKVTLSVGEGYRFTLAGSGERPLTSPDLVLRDETGAVVSLGAGDAFQESLEFIPSESGTYYLDVGGYNSASTGTYTVSGTSRAALPIYTNEQIAQFLTDGYWNATGDTRHVFAGSTITYDIDGLTPEGQALAVAALQAWSAVSGLTFSAVTDGAQITFHDDISAAFTTHSATDGVTTQANINIGTQWLWYYGSGINSYSYQTYLHEIGHALGLGHAGNYNFSGSWSAYGEAQNHYLNDSVQATLMSYFNQDQNTFVDATNTFVIGPMMADIIAIQQLYGLPVTANSGDTTYGFGSNAVGYFDFIQLNYPKMAAFTIYDGGGSDTLNLSGYYGGQRVDLRSGHYSDVGGQVGNIGIAVNTVIENAIGGSGSDALIGNASANILDGRGGADELSGGAGDDTYLVDHADDVVVEAVGDGADRVLTRTGYQLAEDQEIEILELADNRATDALDLGGNAFANTLRGNDGANRLDGGAGGDRLYGLGGDDLYLVDDANDLVFEAASGGYDRIVTTVDYILRHGQHVEQIAIAADLLYEPIDLTGNELGNELIGNMGSNRLSGRGGADVMRGLDGDDIYLVDDPGDLVFEDAYSGWSDRVYATVSYALQPGQHVEILALAPATGVSALTLTGNELANRLVGNAGNNVLVGGAGDDILTGGLGDDILRGGDGDDIYHVDSAGDVVSEIGTGDDLVRATVGVALGAHVERLALDGTAAINGTGNALANTILGNAAANILRGAGGNDILIGHGGNDVLDGGLGDDILRGGDGDDVYRVDSKGDMVVENGTGMDRVLASVTQTLAANVERLVLTGTAAIDGTGNALENRLVGNASDNILDGKLGRDVLTGGLGRDSFNFTTAPSAANVDRITDFDRVSDRIVLDDAVFTALSEGALDASAFKDLADGPVDDDDRIIYASASGALYYDANGNDPGERVIIAVLTNKAALHSADFLVV